MVERINLLLKAKNVTARQFAEEIGIQPSGMSHILSGRNNPSLDFVMKVVRRWPEVNINWLMFGNGEMLASLPLNAQSSSQQFTTSQHDMHQQNNVVTEDRDLFSLVDGDTSSQSSSHVSESSELFNNNERDIPEAAKNDVSSLASTQNHHDDTVKSEISQPAENRVNEVPKESGLVQPILAPNGMIPSKGKKIAKIVVLYDDRTFAEYFPE